MANIEVVAPSENNFIGENRLEAGKAQEVIFGAEERRGRKVSGPVLRLTEWDLVQRVLHAAEGRVQARAQLANHGDDRHRNPGCDQAIFNGRCTTFVTQELAKDTHHTPLFGVSVHPSPTDASNVLEKP
jgi:hypothetical protein